MTRTLPTDALEAFHKSFAQFAMSESGIILGVDPNPDKDTFDRMEERVEKLLHFVYEVDEDKKAQAIAMSAVVVIGMANGMGMPVRTAVNTIADAIRTAGLVPKASLAVDA